MNTSAEYELFAILLSVVAVILATVHLWRAISSYQKWHDERAAVSLGKGVGLFVIALGLLVSSTGFMADTSDLAVAGLSIVRGALIVLLATLILANIQPEHRDSVADTRSSSKTRSTDPG